MFPGEYDGDRVKEWAKDSQLRALRADLARFRKWGYTGWGSEGFWALALYRLQRSTRALEPKPVWLPVRASLAAVKKIFTLVTQINLEAGADIGPGTLIPHVGPIRVDADAKIGADCAIHHVVTIGKNGIDPGGATIGDHVMIGCHAAVLGPVHVGDGAHIASSSLVISDVPAWSTAIGVPAHSLPPTEPPASIATPERTRTSTAALVATPATVSPPARNAYEAVLERAGREEERERVALSEFRAGEPPRTWSWSTTAAAARAAKQYVDAHLAPDDHVLVLARRTPESVALLFGAIGARRSFSWLNPRWRMRQVQRVVELTRTRTIFVDDAGRRALADSSTAAPRDGIELVDVRDVVAAHGVGERSVDERVVAERRVSGVDATGAHDDASPSVSRPACTLFTSGSTGEPKGVRISQQDLAWRAATEVQWYALDRADVLLNLLPFSFDVGLNQLLAAAYAGSETMLCESWLPRDVLAAAEARGVTGIPCVPSIWQDFLQSGMRFDVAGAHRSLRFLTISGGDLPKAHLDRVDAIAPGVKIWKTYGQTEAFRATSLPPSRFALKRATVGGPFPGVTCCVVRDDGSIAARGEVGELVHAGLGVMLGYLGDDARTAAKLRPAPFDAAKRAIFTGDRAFIDDDGDVHLVGRIDQMVKIRGNRVYPNEVRSALCDVTGVHDAIVLTEKGRDDASVLVAFVVAPGAGEDALRREVRARLPGYMVPEHLVVVDELPRTSNGKPDGEAMRQRAQALVAAERIAIPRAQATNARAMSERIEALVRERFDVDEGAHHAMRDVLDSLAFVQLVAAINDEFRIDVDLSRIAARDLDSPAALAEAMLAASMPLFSGRGT